MDYTDEVTKSVSFQVDPISGSELRRWNSDIDELFAGASDNVGGAITPDSTPSADADGEATAAQPILKKSILDDESEQEKRRKWSDFRLRFSGKFGRRGSFIQLPAVRIKTRGLILIAALFTAILCVATIDALRTIVVEERLLLTSRGREARRNRRRTENREQLCDERDEPGLWRVLVPDFVAKPGWKRLASCVEYDLSLRKRPLRDVGVRRLVRLLSRDEYATGEYASRLRVLNLERQGITRRGAGYIARWLSADPVQPPGGDGNENTTSSDYLLDVDRIPIAAFRYIYINLEGNPIGALGVRDLERAVNKARVNGIRAVVIGGGSSSDVVFRGGGRGLGGKPAGNLHQHVFKLGPIEYSRKSVEMPPWRLPVPWHDLLRARFRTGGLVVLFSLVAFVLGVAVGRWTSESSVLYRIAVARWKGDGWEVAL